MRIVACCLVLVACGGNPAPEKTAPAPPAPPALRSFDRTLHAIDVNGTRLTYRLIGDSNAAPVVFVHGTLGDLRSWSAQETAFAQIYRVLVYSRRYHPPNPPVDDHQSYSAKEHAEDLAGLLLNLGIAPAHIVGSSYGAYTALQLVRDHPQLVRSLVLAEPAVVSLLTGSEAGDSARRAFFTYGLDPARAAFTRGDSVTAIRYFVDAVSGRGTFDRLPPATQADMLAHTFEMRREMVAERADYLPTVSCAELSRITTPVLLIRGERSPRIFQLITDELARCLANDTTVIIPGAGHASNRDNPAYYNQTVARFLRTH
jgi:pimeloyl-ACP methyl ester carboxylesterase